MPGCKVLRKCELMLLSLLLIEFIFITLEDWTRGNIATVSDIEFPGILKVIIKFENYCCRSCRN